MKFMYCNDNLMCTLKFEGNNSFTDGHLSAELINI